MEFWSSVKFMPQVLLRLITVVVFGNSFSAHAFDLKKEASEREWLDRVFYVDGKSLVRNDGFFISPEGRENPVKELEATIELMQREKGFACRFPGRYAYLAPKLGLDTKNVFCEDYEAWKDSFEASGLSIMFASQYLENPASSFGHTYLKVNSNRKTLYLNKVISFAASVPKDVGAKEYIWKGLTGGFQGKFAQSPFYVLFQEYANMEKRDIWEYELNINEEQTERILAVLYEVILHAEFDYMFLSDNCSALLLRLIDIETKKDLMEPLPYHVIPIETVKVLEEKGLVKSSKFYPSITSRMALQAESMKAREVKEVLNYIKDDKKLSEKSSAQSLDLGLEYLNFLRQKSGGVLPPDKKEDFSRYLFLRSKQHSEFAPPLVSSLDPLKASHPQRLSIGGQAINQRPVGLSLAYRPVGKDFFDRPNGYAKESEINFFKTKVFLDAKDSDLSWFNLDVIGIRKYADFNRITETLSWGGNFSIRNSLQNNCTGCYYAEVDSHLGLGKSFLKEALLSYLVFHPTLRVGNLSHHTNVVPQLELGFIKSTEDFSMKVSGFRGFVYDSYEQIYFSNIKSSASWIMSDEFSLNFSHEHYHDEQSWNSWESSVSLYF